MRKLLLYIAFVANFSCHPRKDQIYLKSISDLPEFTLSNVDGSGCLKSSDVRKGKSSIFIYFSPDCEHCQNVTKKIVSNIDRLRSCNIYWVSSDTTAAVKTFSTNNHLDMLSNVFVGMDNKYSFYIKYLPPGTPYIMVYNKERKLVRVYSGETDINSLVYSTQE